MLYQWPCAGVLGTGAGEGAVTGRISLTGDAEPVSECYAFICQHIEDREPGRSQQPPEKAMGTGRKLIRQDLDGDPASRPTNADKQ